MSLTQLDYEENEFIGDLLYGTEYWIKNKEKVI